MDLILRLLLAVALIGVLAYVYHSLARVPTDPSQPDDYDEGFEEGEIHGYNDAMDGGHADPEFFLNSRDHTDYNTGFRDGYANGYEEGTTDRIVEEGGVSFEGEGVTFTPDDELHHKL